MNRSHNNPLPKITDVAILLADHADFKTTKVKETKMETS